MINDFEAAVIKSPIPVVVDFWAIWCVGCKTLDTIIQKLTIEYEGRLKFYKVNVEEYPDISGKYHVSSLPTLLFLRDGKVREMVVGAVSERTIKLKLDKLGR